MRKKLLTLCSVALIGASVSQMASAQRVTPMLSGRFLQLCKKASSLQICDAYISGIADAGALSKVFAKNEGDTQAPPGFCIPSVVSGKDMREQVVAWLLKNSDKLSQPVGASVFTALHEAYPCKDVTTTPKTAVTPPKLENGKNP